MSQTRNLEFATGLDGKLAIAHAYLGLMKVGRQPGPCSCDAVRAILSSSNGTASMVLQISISGEWLRDREPA